MTETTSIKRNSFISIMSLFFQSGYSAMLGFAANIALTILFSPEIFGIYITVLSIITILNYFSDIGMAASLIQRDRVEDADYKTAFTIQQILVISIISIGFLLSSMIVNFYRLPDDGKILYWALLLGFFISSLKTIPSVKLERKIQFQKIVFVQIVENTCFYISVVIFALFGFGLLSFAYSVILRAITGLILIYSLSFWLPRVGINRNSLRHLVSYGVPFQSISFLALVKDELVNLFLGKVVGFTGLGYIGWAKKWGEAPLRIIMDSLSRVMFPVFSRIQSDKDKLRQGIQLSLRYQTMILFPTIIGFIFLMPVLVEIVPRYNKWTMALPLFYLFAIASFFSSYSTPFINLFNALGRVKWSFGFMIMWTVGTWILIIPATKLFGYMGFALVTFILSLSFAIVLYKAKKLVEFSFMQSVMPSIFSGIAMGMVLFIISFFNFNKNVQFVMYIITGISSYIFFLYFLYKINPIKEFITLVKNK